MQVCWTVWQDGVMLTALLSRMDSVLWYWFIDE
jgi:hypothetical protein